MLIGGTFSYQPKTSTVAYKAFLKCRQGDCCRASRIQRVSPTVTKSSVYLVGGLHTQHLPDRGRPLGNFNYWRFLTLKRYLSVSDLNTNYTHGEFVGVRGSILALICSSAILPLSENRNQVSYIHFEKSGLKDKGSFQTKSIDVRIGTYFLKVRVVLKHIGFQRIHSFKQ